MERRLSERKVLRLKAERISGNQRYAVFIENLSENGISIIIPANSSEDLVPDVPLDIKFRLSQGETVTLYCRVRWSYDSPDDGLTRNIGMEIIDPPEKYKEFLKNIR